MLHVTCVHRQHALQVHAPDQLVAKDAVMGGIPSQFSNCEAPLRVALTNFHFSHYRGVLQQKPGVFMLVHNVTAQIVQGLLHLHQNICHRLLWWQIHRGYSQADVLLQAVAEVQSFQRLLPRRQVQHVQGVIGVHKMRVRWPCRPVGDLARQRVHLREKLSIVVQDIVVHQPRHGIWQRKCVPVHDSTVVGTVWEHLVANWWGGLHWGQGCNLFKVKILCQHHILLTGRHWGHVTLGVRDTYLRILLVFLAGCLPTGGTGCRQRTWAWGWVIHGVFLDHLQVLKVWWRAAALRQGRSVHGMWWQQGRGEGRRAGGGKGEVTRAAASGCCGWCHGLKLQPLKSLMQRRLRVHSEWTRRLVAGRARLGWRWDGRCAAHEAWRILQQKTRENFHHRILLRLVCLL